MITTTGEEISMVLDTLRTTYSPGDWERTDRLNPIIKAVENSSSVEKIVNGAGLVGMLDPATLYTLFTLGLVVGYFVGHPEELPVSQDKIN